MASIEDRQNGILHPSTGVDLLTEVMVSAQMRHAKLKVPAKRRYAESVVRAAIRRNGFTDADQRLVMDSAERAEWEASNPLAD